MQFGRAGSELHLHRPVGRRGGHGAQHPPGSWVSAELKKFLQFPVGPNNEYYRYSDGIEPDFEEATGKCGIKITNIQEKHHGVWKCRLGIVREVSMPTYYLG